jgi:hypothetical protein
MHPRRDAQRFAETPAHLVARDERLEHFAERRLAPRRQRLQRRDHRHARPPMRSREAFARLVPARRHCEACGRGSDRAWVCFVENLFKIGKLGMRGGRDCAAERIEEHQPCLGAHIPRRLGGPQPSQHAGERVIGPGGIGFACSQFG